MSKYAKILYAALAVWVVFLIIVLVTNIDLKKTDNTYYLPAEVLAVSETATYFGCENGQVYAVNATHYSDQFPYLLCMDPAGTKDPVDDMVLVVWRAE